MPLLVAFFFLLLLQQLIDLDVPVVVLRKGLAWLDLFLLGLFLLGLLKVKVDDEVAHFFVFLGV